MLPPVAATPPKPWTVLVWSASDNDMYAYQVGDLHEMQTTDRVNLVSQIDHHPVGGTLERLALGQPVPIEQERPMNDPQGLADFIQWGVEKYPAQNYWLVISGHGDAWHGACETGPNADYMSVPQLQQALETARAQTGQKLSLLSFDACYMGSVEAAYQLRHEAQYMVGSQEEVGYYGLPYMQVLPEAAALSPKALAERLVEYGKALPVEYKTLAAFDLEKLDGVADAVKTLGQAVVASPQALTQARDGAQEFYGYRDLSDLAEQLAQADPTLKPAAEAVQAAVGQAVFAEAHAPSHPRSHGLQIETRSQTPADYEVSDQEWQAAYGVTEFARATGWQETFKKFSPAAKLPD